MSNPRAYLTLTIHNHQPVGNFEWVFEGAYERCYKPFIDMLEAHPSIKVALHYSGPLLDWFELKHPEFVERLVALARSGRIELLGGGYYEPILAVLPIQDALGQLELQAAWIERRTGARPRGIWLTERIWEPALPDLLSAAKVEYTLADDNHFRYAGLADDQLAGYYLTENRGHKLALFPIDRTLRYTIPFKEPEQTIEHLRSRSRFWPGVVLNYGDDGEKFGLWPDTFDWVYGARWLERFFVALEQSADWLELITPGEALQRFERVGRVYLPTASYHEMMEWALPAEAGAQLRQLIEELKRRGDYERMLPFLRGGFWNNFFVKYPESNRMHKRMLKVSRMLAAAGPEAPEQARLALYRSQCNCAYWHGLFGGLYLNYLRHAVYQNLLAAERLLDEHAGLSAREVAVEREDFDCCGSDELLVRTSKLCATVQLSHGGSLSEISYRPADFCLTDVLARRPEAYHALVGADAQASKAGAPQSIHDQQHSKEPGLERALHYDWHERLCFIDHLLGDGFDLEGLETARYREWGDFANLPYELAGLERRPDGSVAATVRRDGGMWITAERHPLVLEKTYRFAPGAATIEVALRLTNAGAEFRRVNYGCELNLTLLAGDSADRLYEIPGVSPADSRLISRGVVQGLRGLALIDRTFGMRIGIEADLDFTLYRWPLYTVSQSDGGFERTYQGSCLLLVRQFELPPGESAQINFTLAIEEARG